MLQYILLFTLINICSSREFCLESFPVRYYDQNTGILSNSGKQKILTSATQGSFFIDDSEYLVKGTIIANLIDEENHYCYTIKKICQNCNTEYTNCPTIDQAGGVIFDNQEIWSRVICDSNSITCICNGVNIVNQVSCVELPVGYCEHPHNMINGTCIKITTRLSQFKATQDHLIRTKVGWKLIRELKIGDILNSGVIKNIEHDICVSLNSCISSNHIFSFAGETFSDFPLITPDNVNDNLI